MKNISLSDKFCFLYLDIMQNMCTTTQTCSDLWEKKCVCFLSAGYQKALIRTRLCSKLQHQETMQGWQRWRGVHLKASECRIQGSLGSVIFCSAAWSHHGVGNSAVWKVFYREAHKPCVPTCRAPAFWPDYRHSQQSWKHSETSAKKI